MMKPNYTFWGERDGYLIFIDRNTGQEKRTKLASDKQMEYLNKLRVRAGKRVLGKRVVAFKASADIDKFVKKFEEEDRQAKLF